MSAGGGRVINFLFIEESPVSTINSTYRHVVAAVWVKVRVK